MQCCDPSMGSGALVLLPLLLLLMQAAAVRELNNVLLPL